MRLEEFNALPEREALAHLERCCGSRKWCSRMASERPFSNRAALIATSAKIWSELSDSDWLEAFTHHPRIGDLSAMRAKFASTADWAKQEQAGTAAASERTLQELADGNARYQTRFGHVFLVCATGKSADEMLALLKTRIDNSPQEELCIAAGEQTKITRIRLEKWIDP